MTHIKNLIHVARSRLVTFETYLAHRRLAQGNHPRGLELFCEAERAIGQLGLYAEAEPENADALKGPEKELSVRLHESLPLLGKLTVLNAKEGDLVRAKKTVYDLPGVKFDAATYHAIRPDHIHAEAGDEGVVVHAQPGVYPTVTFNVTGTSTMANDEEVELL